MYLTTVQNFRQFNRIVGGWESRQKYVWFVQTSLVNPEEKGFVQSISKIEGLVHNIRGKVDLFKIKLTKLYC